MPRRRARIVLPGPRRDGRARAAGLRACPVRRPCLDYAISNRIAHGIWGGLTERDRRPLRTRRVRAARRERDGGPAAEAAGNTDTATGRTFGLSPTTVGRVLSRDGDRRRS